MTNEELEKAIDVKERIRTLNYDAHCLERISKGYREHAKGLKLSIRDDNYSDTVALSFIDEQSAKSIFTIIEAQLIKQMAEKKHELDVM